MKIKIEFETEYKKVKPKREIEINALVIFQDSPLKNNKPIIVKIIKIDWPTSGWSNKSDIIIKVIIKGTTWRLLSPSSLDLAKNHETMTISDGFRNSEGWIVKPKADNHLEAPPLFTPINNVKSIPIKLKIKITKDSFLIKLDGKIEIDIKRNKDIEKYIKCLVRKK